MSGFVPSFLRNTQPASKRQALNIILSSSLACKCMGCINRASEGVVSLISLSLFYPKKTTLLLFYRLLSSLSPFSSLHIAVATKPRTKNSFLLCFCCSTFCGCNKEPGCKSWRGRRSSYKVVHTSFQKGIVLPSIVGLKAPPVSVSSKNTFLKLQCTYWLHLLHKAPMFV